MYYDKFNQIKGVLILEKKQPKIAKTYRLLPETIQDIQDIKESFKKQRYEFSSDAQVIQYAVGQAKTFVEEVDQDYSHLRLNKSQLEQILRWADIYESEFGFTKSEQLITRQIKVHLDLPIDEDEY